MSEDREPPLKAQPEIPPAPHIADDTMPGEARADIFFAAVKTTRMPMIVTDPHREDNPIIFCNAAFERMTGYKQSEIVGSNCRFLQGPETDKDSIGLVRDAIARTSAPLVDTSSGVETAPGVKDVALIRAFCEAVRATENNRLS